VVEAVSILEFFKVMVLLSQDKHGVPEEDKDNK
jgi:hypothetical protein